MDAHRRQSIRLRDFDYASAGAYFVTVVTQGRENMFGDVVDGAMVENDVGRMVTGWWRRLAERFCVDTDAYVLMPNHTHGVIFINDVGAGQCACPKQPGRPHWVAPTLGDVVGWFKTMTTNESIRTAGMSRPGKLWQRNYWERVIRDESELNRVRQYITDNPRHWGTDPERQC